MVIEQEPQSAAFPSLAEMAASLSAESGRVQPGPAVLVRLVAARHSATAQTAESAAALLATVAVARSARAAQGRSEAEIEKQELERPDRSTRRITRTSRPVPESNSKK